MFNISAVQCQRQKFCLYCIASIKNFNSTHTYYSATESGGIYVGLLKKIAYEGTSTDDVEYTYCDCLAGCGTVRTMTDGTGVTEYTYADSGSLLSVETTYTGLSAKTIEYTYNPDGSRDTMVTPAGTFEYTYDNLGRLTQLTAPNDVEANWSYNDNSWLKRERLIDASTGPYTDYSYNANGTLSELSNYNGSSNLISRFNNMAYTASGNLTSVLVDFDAIQTTDWTQSYNYDTKNQLTAENTNRTGGTNYANVFDSVGNPTTFRNTSNQTFNPNNQQTGTGTFVYDGNGNPTTYNGTSLSFNKRNNMTAFGASWSAGYNGKGLRAWKNNNGTVTYFIYDGITPVCELDSSGNVKAVNIISIGRVTYSGQTGTTVYYQSDQQGNVIHRLDSSGAVLTNSFYDAWGNLISGSNPDPFGYIGKAGYYTDTETGLILCTHRYYDPTLGRWVTRDPIGYKGGVNLYGYVGNDVVGNIDLEGTNWLSDWIDSLWRKIFKKRRKGPLSQDELACATALCGAKITKKMMDDLKNPEIGIKRCLENLASGQTDKDLLLACIDEAKKRKGWIAKACEKGGPLIASDPAWAWCKHNTDDYDKCKDCCENVFGYDINAEVDKIRELCNNSCR